MAGISANSRPAKTLSNHGFSATCSSAIILFGWLTFEICIGAYNFYRQSIKRQIAALEYASHSCRPVS